jgi:hypothetical protein
LQQSHPAQTPERLRKPVQIAGSLDRRFDRSSSRSALSPRHQRANRWCCLAATPAIRRDSYRTLEEFRPTRKMRATSARYLIIQSRPKPRGGSIAWSSPRSRSQIACSASAVTLSCRLVGKVCSHAAYSDCRATSVATVSFQRWARLRRSVGRRMRITGIPARCAVR